MARTAHGDLAASVAAYFTRSANTVEGFGGNQKEVERQSNCLVEWARAENVVLTDAHIAGLEKWGGVSAEHEVFYRASDNRAVKRTYPGTFGITDTPKGKQHHATPLFYLRRLELMNRVFDSDLRLEGVAFGKSLIIGEQGEKPCMVISQPWIRAADQNNPYPSEKEIEQFMKLLDFAPMKGSYFGWHRKKDGVTIRDARPDNFIKSSEGVVPIDLVISTEKLSD